jgi:hypothetical protein
MMSSALEPDPRIVFGVGRLLGPELLSRRSFFPVP